MDSVAITRSIAMRAFLKLSASLFPEVFFVLKALKSTFSATALTVGLASEVFDFTWETVDAAYTFLTESLKAVFVANHWSADPEPEQFALHFEALPMAVTVNKAKTSVPRAMPIATFFFPSRIGVTSIFSVGRFMLCALGESKKPAKYNRTKLLQVRP